MLDTLTNILTPATDSSASITVTETILIVVLSAVLGLLIAAVYKYTYRGVGYTQEFAVTLVMLCVIISIVVYAIGSNVARAFSFAGALSIIRFRTAMGNPRDIAFVLFAVAAGMCVGIGTYVYALIVVLALFVLVIAMTLTNAFSPRATSKRLKITIAENMNYEGLFDPILEKYCAIHTLERVASIDLGTLFELVYDVEIKKGANEKQMLDELRCKNGNLSISLLLAASKDKASA